MATFLYYADFQHYTYCENWIAEALDRNGHHCLRVQRRPKFQLETIIEICRGVDYFLTTKSPEITGWDLNQIREQARAKILLWTFDWMRHPSYWAWYEQQAKNADICFQTDGIDDGLWYSNQGIRRVELHQGVVPGLHDLPRHLNTELVFGDVAFIGSLYTARRNELYWRLYKYGVVHYGNPMSEIWGSDFAQVCYYSKIVVGDNFVNNVPGYWSDRVYLTLGCGGFFITAYVPGLEREFENRKHLVWYRDLNELEELIQYYLPREAERKRIALAGYRLVHSEHTYDRRIEKMTEELAGLNVL